MNRNKVSGILLMIYSLFFLQCSRDKGKTTTIISYGTDTLSSRGMLLVPPNKYDSAINWVINRDSMGLFFLSGFRNTNVSLFLNDNLFKKIQITSNRFTEFAKQVMYPKEKGTIKMRIGGDDYRFPIIKKYFIVLVRYDSVEKKMEVNYSNDVPIFY